MFFPLFHFLYFFSLFLLLVPSGPPHDTSYLGLDAVSLSDFYELTRETREQQRGKKEE